MPITLNHSNISVQYSTGSNYIIETVKSDLYIRDSRTGISSNLTGEPVVTAPTFTETIRTFIHSGGTEAQTTYNITIPQNTICDILMIGGGGSGGVTDAGGGGAGACIVAINQTLSAGTYTIRVGKGGEGGSLSSTSVFTKLPTNGSNSSILNQQGNEIFRAVGGGRAGGAESSGDYTLSAPFVGKVGGCGGGAGFYQGYNATSGGSASTLNIVNGVSNIGPSVTSTYGVYGNSGGSAQQWTNGNYSTANCGGGGGIGTAGASGTASTNRSGVGGNGLNAVTINAVTYNFSTHFTNGGVFGVGGYIGGGGGGGGYSNSPAKISGGLGGGGTGDCASNNATFSDAPTDGAPNTGSGGGGGCGNAGANGGNGGSGIVVIKFKSIAPPLTEGNPITHKTLNFAYDQTRYVEYQAQLKTGVGGWRIVRYLPPTTTTWYPINDNLAGTTSSGILYSYTNYWTVPFGTFDEFVFATFNMNYWLYCTKTTAYASYNNTAANIIKSSFSATPYTALWYNRGASYPNDPVLLIDNSTSDAIYAENSGSSRKGFISIDGGMCVLVRNSTTNTTIPNPNTYTLDFPVPTTTDILERIEGRGILNNSNLILQGTYDINLTDATTLIVPRTGQYLPFTATSNLSQNIGFRYHLLNPIKMPEGAQWTYNSSNANVYHLGNVGIGTTNPSYNLHINGTIFSSTGGYTQSGLTTWTVMSDRRIKENIVKASYDKCLENVKNIELYNFNFKDNYVNTNDRHQLGFIAQEVQQVYPKAVGVGKMIIKNNDGIENILSLNTTQIEYTLYGAVKKLIDNIEEMENEIAEIDNTSNITTQA